LFVAAMESMGVSNCRMVPSQLTDEDKLFLEQSDLILLAEARLSTAGRCSSETG